MQVHPVPERENIFVGLMFLLAAAVCCYVMAKEKILESFKLDILEWIIGRIQEPEAAPGSGTGGTEAGTCRLISEKQLTFLIAVSAVSSSDLSSKLVHLPPRVSLCVK